MSNFIVDFNTKQITLIDARWYTKETGQWVPSVSTFLEAYPKDYGYFKWLKEVGEEADTIRDEAGRRGSVVHDLAERYDKGEEVTLLNDDGHLNFRMSDWAFFERYVEFTRRFSPQTHMIEQTIVSTDLGYAGTLDRTITIDGRLLLVDIKTSNQIYPSYWCQLAAYRALLQHELGAEVDAVAILWLNAKTRTNGGKGDIQGKGWQMIIRDDTTKDMHLFECARQLWLAQNEGTQPRQLSYKMSYKK